MRERRDTVAVLESNSRKQRLEIVAACVLAITVIGWFGFRRAG
jgi:hypothetical protein